MEEQGKIMVEATCTRRLLDTVNAVKDTGELLFQIIEMSRRVESLINDAKVEIKIRTISDEEEDWGDHFPP